jgi:hypothetical protein
LVGNKLFNAEVDVKCWAAYSEVQQRVTTTRAEVSSQMDIILILMFTYFIIDIVRILSVIACIFKSGLFGLIYIVLQLNEYFGLCIIGLNYYYRFFSFSTKLCAGDYPLYKIDATLT